MSGAISHLKQYPFLKKALWRNSKNRCNEIVEKVAPYLLSTDSIIDIGAAFCMIDEELMRRNYNVKSVDIVDMSLTPHVKPIIYDGKRLPFKDNSFDVALLLTVLHHTPNPQLILKEASRVARKIIIMEDVFDSALQKYMTFAMDSIVNLEFINHPHTNKTKKGWLKTFNSLNLHLVTLSEARFWKLFNSVLFVVERATYTKKKSRLRIIY